MILGYSNPSSKTLCVYGRLRVFKRGLTRITFDPSIFPFPKASRRDIPPRVCTFARRPQFARNFSSRKANSGSDAFQNTFGLSFSISPDRALQKFEAWARTEQGLNSFLMKGKSVRITAAYCPVWSFDVNVRYIITDPATGRKRFDWKPDLFSVYGTQSVIHVPGLAAYAGHTYRRSLIDPLHNTALVFIGEKIVPFGAWMLRDMKLSTGERLQVYPDPWNTTRGRAFAIVKEALESLPGASGSEIRVQTEVVSSRRVYMPTYAFNYKVLGME